MTEPHKSYEVFEEIGRGDDTIVSRAHDLHLGRDVAIKQLRPELASNPQRREQFLSEAKFLAQFDHPAVLRIHSVEPQHGWIVMDLMKGSLAAQIQHAPLPCATVQSILYQLLPALEFLHERGKLHGSIRPSNILIDDDGRVKLSDFEETNHDGELRAPAGTKKYLAPELIRSDFGSVGPATDLYCLGFTALELLVGPTFDSKFLSGSSAAIDADVAWLRWHSSNDGFPATSKLAKGVSKTLATVIDSMLCKPVDERLKTAADAIKSLGEQDVVPVIAIAPAAVASNDSVAGLDDAAMMPSTVREIEPLVASQATSTDNLSSRRRSARPAAVESVQAGAAMAAGDTAATSRTRMNEVLEKPCVLYPLCGMILGVALLIGLALRRPSTKEVAIAPEPPAQANPPKPEPVETQPILQPDQEPKFAPEQAELADTGKAGSLEASATTPEIDPGTEHGLATSEPTEDLLPAVDPLELAGTDPEPEPVEPGAVIDSEPVLVEPVLAEPEVAEPVPPVMPRLEFVSTRIDINELVEEFEDNPELVIDSGGFIAEVLDIAISPDGKLLAAAGEKVVRIWELGSGSLVATLRGDRARTSYGDCNAVEFSRDGQHIVVGVSDYEAHGNLRVYRLDNLDEIDRLLAGHTAPVRKIDFSRDGRWMATADADGHVALWDWDAREITKMIPPRDAQQPIFDELHFPGDEPVLAGIDFQGPMLLSVPEMRRLSGQDDLPPRTLAWIYDVLTGKVKYPLATTDDPRNMDLRLDAGKWAAAGVGKENGGNKFWVGLWDARTMESAVVADPAVVYSGHKWNVTAIDLAPEHQLVASGDKFGEIHVWDSSTAKRLYRFKGQGKPIYEAAFDRNSNRIAYGTKSFTPDVWDRNNYGRADRVIDLEKRAIYSIDSAENIDLIGEQPSLGDTEIKVTAEAGRANMAVEKIVGGAVRSRYDLTTGRNPTVYSILGNAVMGVEAPVLIGDNLGLFALWDSDRDELKRAFIGHEGLVSSISASPVGNMVLSSSADRTLRIWSFDDAKATGKFDFKFENSIVTKVEPGTSSAKAGVEAGDRILDIDGKTITQMYRDMLEGEFEYSPGQVVPVRMKRGDQEYSFDMELAEGYDFAEPTLSVYIGDQDQWIIWTPQGYYDASPGAEQLIGWHINRGPDKSARYFKVQQFREHLYRPDIINRILSGTPTDEAIADANQTSQEAEVVDFRSPSELALRHPPEVEFLSPAPGDELANPSVQLKARVYSRNGLPIQEVTVLVNGIATQVLKPMGGSAQELNVDLPITLAIGRNDIEVIAANAEATSFAESVYVNVAESKTEQSSAENTAKLNVLAIGISDYAASSGGFQDLPLAASDAQQFIATAKEQAGGQLYANIQSRSLTNQQATRTAILDGLQWLVDNTDDGDSIAIFVSANGFVDSTKNFYIGTHEVDIDRPRATAISWREFIRTLHADLPSCRRLLFLDLHPTEQAVSPDIRNPLLDLAAPEMGTIFFSSNSLQQTSLPRPPGDVGYSAGGLQIALQDTTADVEPEQPDSLLNAHEISQAWTQAVRTLSADRFYPVAFTPEKSRRLAVFQLQQ
ncbi:MAG: hypothetical protein Aurels2KO_03670 [Aureliella sp.]